jgi:predicted RNase H-like nuclease (RuvC/YqgF family)
MLKDKLIEEQSHEIIEYRKNIKILNDSNNEYHDKICNLENEIMQLKKTSKFYNWLVIILIVLDLSMYMTVFLIKNYE